MNPETLFNSLDRIGPAARVVVKGLRHRGELAAIETGEAGEHLAGSLALGVGSLVFAVLGGFAVNFAVAASLWHRDDRGLLLALFAGLQLLLAVATGLLVARRLRRWHPLPETRRQLREDCECVQDLLPTDSRNAAPTP